MHKVHSSEELQQIKQLGDTIYLRKNIEQVIVEDGDGSTHQEWQADEVSFEKENADLQKIENNFLLYFDWANEKMQREQLEEEKEELVRELIENNKLANLKDVVDTLVAENL